MLAALEGRLEMARRDHEHRAWLAHTIAALDRVKKLPPLSDLAPPRTAKRKKPRSAEEQDAALRAWVSSYG